MNILFSFFFPLTGKYFIHSFIPIQSVISEWLLMALGKHTKAQLRAAKWGINVVYGAFRPGKSLKGGQNFIVLLWFFQFLNFQPKFYYHPSPALETRTSLPFWEYHRIS